MRTTTSCATRRPPAPDTPVRPSADLHLEGDPRRRRLRLPLAFRVAGHQLLFVATEAGSVYALDASTGEAVWKRDLGTVTTADCGTWGITSTGAIDPTRGLLFVIGATGSLHALDLSTGEEPDGLSGAGRRPDRLRVRLGRPRIAGGRAYVPIASYCDVAHPTACSPKEACSRFRSTAAPERQSGDPVPGPQNLGGIWGWEASRSTRATGRSSPLSVTRTPTRTPATASSTTRGTETTSSI